MFVLSSEPTEMVKACIDDSQTLHFVIEYSGKQGLCPCLKCFISVRPIPSSSDKIPYMMTIYCGIIISTIFGFCLISTI